MAKYIIGIDAGTTGIRAIAFDHDSNILSNAYSEFTQYFPEPGWVEHDADEIYDVTMKMIEQCISDGGLNLADLVAIGITNQRETTVLWDKNTGKAVARSIVWQDMRTADRVTSFNEKYGDSQYGKVGSQAMTNSTGPKIEWIMEHHPEVKKGIEDGDVLFGWIDTWLIWKLSGGKAHVTDYTNLAGTLLGDITKLDYHEEMLAEFGIPRSIMPEKDNPLVKEIGILGGDILLDGSIGSRTAAFFDNYCDGEGCGYLNFTEEQVNSFVENGVINDLGMSFHVIGEKAAHVALNAYERALELHPEKRKTAKLRLEHFGWQTPEDMQRAAAMDVKISTQPAFTYLRGGPESIYRSRLGEEREKSGYSLRRMLDARLCIGGGSDSDITPLDALLGIHAAVNPPYPENAVTPYEAVRMYTSDGAKSGWEDDYKGKLIPGMQADMVILDADPMTVNPQTIKDITVLGTIRKGELVYSNL